MRLISLEVAAFRNLRELSLRPPEGLCLIDGDNGLGKTNLLEAIHCAAAGRSFRTRRDEDCVPRPPAIQPETPSPSAPSPSSATARVDSLWSARSGERAHRYLVDARGKRVLVDDRLQPRLADLWRDCALVCFQPSDAEIFREAPGERRRFLDQSISQVHPAHMEALMEYQRAQKQINASLRAGAPAPRIEAFVPTLARAAATIMRLRRDAIGALGPRWGEKFRELGGGGLVSMRAVQGMRIPAARESAAESSTSKPTPEALSLEFLRGLERSRREGSLAEGPHRDDFAGELDGRELARFGSQGQNRLAALSLKLAAAEWIEAARGESPVLLLDDFGSELDPARRRRVLEGLRGRMQVFVTATERADLGGAGLFDLALRLDERGRLEGGGPE